MGKRRKKRLVGLILAVSLIVSGIFPQSFVLASEVAQDIEITAVSEVEAEGEVEAAPEAEGEVEAALEVEAAPEAEGEVEAASDVEGEAEAAPEAEADTKSEEAYEEPSVEEAFVLERETDGNVGKDADKNVEENTPAALATLDVTERNGLYAEYWRMTDAVNAEFASLMSTGVDYGLDYSNMDPKLKMATGWDEHAGVKWRGRIKVPVTGNYTFYAYADNGVRIRVNSSQMIHYWDGESWEDLQTSDSVALEAGTYYPFEVDYFEHVGGSHVTISWSNDKGMDKTVIPSSALFLPEDYTGPYIDTMTGEHLTDDDSFDGVVTISGKGFSDVSRFELVKVSGTSLEPVVYAEVHSREDNSAEVVIPNVGAGTYKLKAIADAAGHAVIPCNVISKGVLLIKPDTLQPSTRTEHPRADWVRESYVNLNGWWDFDFDPSRIGQTEGWYQADKEFESNINVPFCWESPLGGINNPDYKGEAWYQRTVTVDASWAGKKIFLLFGAVDWKCKLWVNGELAGEHIGGYSAFEMDVTDYMNAGSDNVVTLWVEDWGNYGDNSYPALIGKQGRNAPCGYIHTSGIWQTVGMEARSATYLNNARASSDISRISSDFKTGDANITYTLDLTTDKAQELTVDYKFESTLYDVEEDKDNLTGSVMQGSQKIRAASGTSTVTLSPVAIKNGKLWSDKEPNLYQGTITIKDSEGKTLDKLSTYFGIRKIETKYFDESLGVKYIYLNGTPVYSAGLLDQGFWEEGIYTAPTEEALRFDILAMKNAGFNMIRKHLKIEDPLQYYWCDKLGMMVWQDMPHATAMVPKSSGGAAPGRVYFEECLDAAMKMNYNHPSIVAIMLFNETWGLKDAYDDDKVRGFKADDGKSTAEWVEYLYHKTKELNPNILVEDMSPCNYDHVQPTDLNTYHFYPDSYSATVREIERHVNGAYVGSDVNFEFGELQDGDPLLNSEYGGVGAYEGDYDVSYCFKYMTDAQRRYEKQSGYVYTEPYDVEYERNGILTYDRQEKIFGYDEIAYGGDMTIKDLNQDIYIGVIDEPIRTVTAGSKIKTQIMAMAWSYDLPENTLIKWRFDGTDIYGNDISTGLSGVLNMKLEPFTKITSTLSFLAPYQACAGTLTVWIESNTGEKIAKNFTNIIITDHYSTAAAKTVENEDGSIALQARLQTLVSGQRRMDTTTGNETRTYDYTLPDDFELSDLNGLRILAEASSYKGEMGSDKNLSSYSSAYGQTAAGREAASDLTVSVNGVEIDTVYLPDNPRDMRGTLTLDKPYNGNTSAGDFGYLINLNVTPEKLTEIKAAMGDEKTISISYQVKSGAAHANGFRIYSSIYGRYAVNPTIILNPGELHNQSSITASTDVAASENNYSTQALLSLGAAFTVRADAQGGYQVKLEDNGSRLVLTNVKTNQEITSVSGLSAGAHEVKVTVFDEKIRIYTDNNPEPAIEVYDYSGFTGGVHIDASSSSAVTNLVVSPESYPAPKAEPKEEPTYEVDFTDDFSNENYTERYDISTGGNNWNASVSNGKWNISANNGGKAIMKDMTLADGIYEADITLTNVNYNTNDGRGNLGFLFRGTNWTAGTDGVDGYYAGFGNGFIQLGRMNQNWTELANVSVPSITLNSTHTLRVATFGSRIQVYLDNETTPRIDIVDTKYQAGGVAIRGFKVQGNISGIRVKTLPLYQTGFEKGIGEWDISGVFKATGGVFTSTSENAFALVDSTKIKDLSYSADVIFTSEKSKAALLFRTADDMALKGCRLVVDAENDKLQIIKAEDDQTTVLGERNWQLKTGKTYRFTVETNGSSIRVYVDNYREALIIAEDTAYSAGRIGVLHISGGISIDNIQIHTDLLDGTPMPAADTSRLKQAEAKAKSLVSDDYTKESWDKLLKSLEAIQGINIYDQKEIDAALKSLEAAMTNLVKRADTKSLDKEIEAAGKLDASKYTEASYAKVKTALQKAKTVNREDYKAVEAAIKELKEAMAGLKPKENTPQKPPAAKPVPKKNSKHKVGKLNYKVTKSSASKGTVTVTGLANKKEKTISIPKTVKLNGYTFKVTQISKNAFRNSQKLTTVKIADNVVKIGDQAFIGCKSLKKVTIGKGLTTIGKKAFYNDKKLTGIVIKSVKLTKIYSGAFKKISSKAVVKVPAKVKAKYKTMFKKAGITKVK